MADFNAYPALDVRVPPMVPGPDLGSVFEQANKIQAGRNENSLFPLKQQAFQTENAMNQLILGEAQQAQKYNNVNRQLKGIAAQFKDDPKGAEKAWNTMMADPAFPEGKQWGEISANKLNTALKTYGQQEQTSTNRVRAGTAAAQQQQSGNAFGGNAGGGFSASQDSAFGQMNPQQTQGQVAAFNKMSDWLNKIGDSKDTAGEWNKELDNPNFRKVFGSDKFSWDRYKAIKDQVDSRKEAMAGFGVNAAQGLQNPRDPQKFQQSGDSIFVEHPYDYEHPLKEVGRGATKPNWQLDTYTEKNGETYPVYHDTTSGKQKIGDFPAVGGKYDTKGKGGTISTADQIEDWAQRIHHGDAKIEDVAKEDRPTVNSRVAEIEKTDTRPPGLTGSPDMDPTVEGYATKIVPGTGGWTQAAIDSAAADFGPTNRYPVGLGIGTSGPTGQTKKAIATRSGEMYPGGVPTEKRAQIQALTAAMKQQVQTATTTERAVQNFDDTFQHLTTAFKDKVNDYTTPLANMIANPAKYQLDPGTLGAFKAGLQEVSNEYNFVNGRGGQITDQVRKQSGDILPGNLNMKDLQKIHDELSAQGKIIVKGGWNEANKVSKQFSNVRSGAALGGNSLPVMSSPAEARQKLQPGDHFKTPDGREMRVPK